MTAPYRCPTSCDPDCELSAWACHERHDVPSHREHDPEACEARMLVQSLAWMISAGWQVQFGRYAAPGAPFWVHLVSRSLRMKTFDGASSGEAILRALEWSEREGITP